MIKIIVQVVLLLIKKLLDLRFGPFEFSLKGVILTARNDRLPNIERLSINFRA
jgi:hypothetical protein